MNRKKIEQIKALLDTGFSEHQIRDILNATDDEILQAMGVENTEEKPKAKPKTKAKKEPKQILSSIKVSEEIFPKIKEDMANGIGRDEIMKKYNIGNSLFFRVKKSDTYEDLCKLREEASNWHKKKTPRIKVANYYTKELWEEGKAMREQGLTYKEIAARQGYSTNFVAKALSPDTYQGLEEVRAKEVKNRKENFEEAKKQVLEEQLDPKLVELRSIADSAERMAEALESIKELIAYRKRGFFRK